MTILEAAQRAIQLETGEIDTLRGPNFPDIDRLRDNGDLTVTELAEWSGYILTLNWERTDLGWDDVRVRQALSHAINRQAIIDNIFFSFGEPLFGPVTSAAETYNPGVEEFNQFDLDGANALMEEAGWTKGDDGIYEKDGVKQAFTLTIQSETFNDQIATAVQEQFKELGADVTIQSVDRDSYFGVLFGNEAEMSLFFYLWPVPVDVVILFVNSATATADSGGPNFSNARSERVDAAIDAYFKSGDEAEAYQQTASRPADLDRRGAADHSGGQPQRLLGEPQQRAQLRRAPVEPVSRTTTRFGRPSTARQTQEALLGRPASLQSRAAGRPRLKRMKRMSA